MLASPVGVSMVTPAISRVPTVIFRNGKPAEYLRLTPPAAWYNPPMRKIITVLTLSLGLCFSAAAAAQFTEGEHYAVLRAPQPVQTGDKIEVLELFWYGCPHCYRLEPYIQRWLRGGKPDNAEYVPLPAVLRESWGFHARVFYTFEALGAMEALHEEFYDAIHKLRKSMRNAEDAADFAAEHGVDREEFLSAFNSFGVETRLRQGAARSTRYAAPGVPSIIVDGKYRTSVSAAGGPEELMEVVNFLVRKSAGERG